MGGSLFANSREVGWAIGDGQEHGDDPAWDAIELNQLYDILEHEVIPEFYARNEHGIPTQWLSRMRASMSLLTPQYSAVRTIREYTDVHYLPAANAYHERADYNGVMGTSIVNWEHSLREKWSLLKSVMSKNIPAEKLNDDRLGKALDAFFTERHSILASFALHVSQELDVPLAEVHYDPTHILFQGAYEESEPRDELPADATIPSDNELPAAHITKGSSTFGSDFFPPIALVATSPARNYSVRSKTDRFQLGRSGPKLQASY